jgi:hypothetical protein
VKSLFGARGPALLLDSKHKTWLVVTIVVGGISWGVYAVWDAGTPGGSTGGSRIGLLYGLLGAGCMVFAGLLSALRRFPRWGMLGSRQWWLRGHIWLGLLSVLFIFCHANYRFGGPIEIALWLVLALTVLSGGFGLLMQHVLPRLLGTQIDNEVPFEQIPHVCLELLRKSDKLVELLCGQEYAPTEGLPAGKRQLRAYYEEQLRPALAAKGRSADTLILSGMNVAAKIKQLGQLPGLEASGKELADLESNCKKRRALVEQERLHAWLHGWLFVHIPLSAALLVLGMVHVVSALYF